MSDETCKVCGRPAWPARSGRGAQDVECDERGGAECRLTAQLATARTALEAAGHAFEALANPCKHCDDDGPDACPSTEMHDQAEAGWRTITEFLYPTEAPALDTPAPLRCETWCGTDEWDADTDAAFFGEPAGKGIGYCTVPCADAGRPPAPAHPRDPGKGWDGVSAMPIPPCKRHHARKGAPCVWEDFVAGRGLYCDDRIRRMLQRLEPLLATRAPTQRCGAGTQGPTR